MSKLNLDPSSKLKLDTDSYLLLDAAGEVAATTKVLVYYAKRRRIRQLA